MSTAPTLASQRGAALLAAMLTVALVATLAAGAMWQQWRGIEVEGAERERAQARWLLVGALDWARVILREDARASTSAGGANTDHLAEPWAVPLQEARLSSFLAALPDGGGSSDNDDTLAQQVFLSGQISDLQGRLNIANLVQNNKVDPDSYAAFARLFDALGVPSQQLTVLAQGLLSAQQHTDSTAPLLPQQVAQLAWLGLTPASLRLLQNHLTVLPVTTPVNVNTASAEVLYASVPGLNMGDARRLVEQRTRGHWSSLDEFKKAMGRDAGINATSHSVETHFFEVWGQLRMPHTTLQERSVVQRNGVELKVLSRESGAWALQSAMLSPNSRPASLQ